MVRLAVESVMIFITPEIGVKPSLVRVTFTCATLDGVVFLSNEILTLPFVCELDETTFVSSLHEINMNEKTTRTNQIFFTLAPILL